jgi:hypothetical protein
MNGRQGARPPWQQPEGLKWTRLPADMARLPRKRRSGDGRAPAAGGRPGRAARLLRESLGEPQEPDARMALPQVTAAIGGPAPGRQSPYYHRPRTTRRPPCRPYPASRPALAPILQPRGSDRQSLDRLNRAAARASHARQTLETLKGTSASTLGSWLDPAPAPQGGLAIGVDPPWRCSPCPTLCARRRTGSRRVVCGARPSPLQHRKA